MQLVDLKFKKEESERSLGKMGSETIWNKVVEWWREYGTFPMILKIVSREHRSW